MTHIEELPDELVENIARLLSIKDVRSFRLVSRKYSSILDKESLREVDFRTDADIDNLCNLKSDIIPTAIRNVRLGRLVTSKRACLLMTRCEVLDSISASWCMQSEDFWNLGIIIKKIDRRLKKLAFEATYFLCNPLKLLMHLTHPLDDFVLERSEIYFKVLLCEVSLPKNQLKIKYIKLDHSKGITDSFFNNLMGAVDGMYLRGLSTMNCRLTESSLQNSIEKLTHIKSLDLRGNIITDQLIMSISTFCSEVEDLRLSCDCGQSPLVSDSSVTYLSAKLRPNQLKVFMFQNFRHVSYSVMKNLLLNHVTSLRILDIQGTKMEASLEELMDHLAIAETSCGAGRCAQPILNHPHMNIFGGHTDHNDDMHPLQITEYPESRRSVEVSSPS